MCLTSKTKFPKIANRDINVFKVVNCQICRKRIYQPDGKKYGYKRVLKITTPYRGIEIPTLPYKLVAEGKEQVEEGNLNSYVIGGGFIHAYRSILTGSCVAEHHNYGLIKAIIPANTMYFIGERNEICAKEMYLQGIVQVYQEDFFFKVLNKHFPEIPVFNIDTIIFKQTNSSVKEFVEEPIKVEEFIEKLEEVYV